MALKLYQQATDHSLAVETSQSRLTQRPLTMTFYSLVSITTLPTSRHQYHFAALAATYSLPKKSSLAWRLLIQLHLRSHSF
jgi:hypothetical protein